MLFSKLVFTHPLEPEEDDRASNHHGEKTRQNNAVTANEASADENIEATAAHFFIDSDHDWNICAKIQTYLAKAKKKIISSNYM